MKRLLFALVAALLVATAAAQSSVALQGMIGGKALLVVDGGAPRIVAAGQTVQGVKVVSTSGDQAVVEFDGRRETLRVGETPGNVGGNGSALRGNRIVLAAASGGHFMTLGAINGHAVQFMVDTGATDVAMSAEQADRIGLDYRSGQLARSGTANGTVVSWRVKLAAVRLGDVEVFNVDASVLPTGMPYVLLGNSFLNRFQMKRDNDQMVLERRY